MSKLTGQEKIIGKIIKKTCVGCGIEYELGSYHRKYRKYCSHGCSIKNHTGNKHPFWKENTYSKHAVHNWVKRWKVKPSFCEVCGTINVVLDWANRDGLYKRILDDYICMCRSCHRKYDMTPEKKQKAIQNLPWYKKIENMQTSKLS